MSGEDEWCDVACALEGLGDASPMHEEEWEVLGKTGTPQSHKKVTDITPTVSLADLAAAPGSGSDQAPASVALDTSTELTTDGEEEDDDDDKMMSSTLTAATSTSTSTAGGSAANSTPDRLAGAAIRLASQANNAFINEMDKIFDPEAAYPGGNAVHISSVNKEKSVGGGGVDAVAKNVAKSAQKIVGNILNKFGQGNNSIKQAACGKVSEGSGGSDEKERRR